jgi:ABC-type nitrate/sulfonate/bicarbonate transport system substrate-binding protein
MAQKSAPVKLTIMVFQGLQNLPLLAARANGFFERRGLDVDIRLAPNSVELRNGMLEGRYQIIHSTSDNAVTLADAAGADIGILIGGDNGFTRLCVQSDVASYADLRGRTILVDAVDTGFTFQILELLHRNGVSRHDIRFKEVGATPRRLEGLLRDKAHAAAMLFPPFSLYAQQAGLKDMGPAVDVAGPYQSTVGYALRPWAAVNEATVVAHLAAYIEGQRWALDPENETAAVRLYADWLKVPDDIARGCCEVFRSGAAKDAALDADGFGNVLALRARHLGVPVNQAEAYMDRAPYRAALAQVS